MQFKRKQSIWTTIDAEGQQTRHYNKISFSVKPKGWSISCVVALNRLKPTIKELNALDARIEKNSATTNRYSKAEIDHSGEETLYDPDVSKTKGQSWWVTSILQFVRPLLDWWQIVNLVGLSYVWTRLTDWKSIAYILQPTWQSKCGILRPWF